MMKYPLIAEVVRADREQVCGWWKLLKSPQTPMEERVMNLIFKKLTALGGYSPELAEESTGVADQLQAMPKQ
jgi:hypothetical protein